MAEIYVPFSWYEPMRLENLGSAAAGAGWQLTGAGGSAPGARTALGHAYGGGSQFFSIWVVSSQPM